MKIEAGQIVILVLHSPREKIWGVLQEISTAGVYIRGIDLNSFDQFIRSVNNGEQVYGLSNVFFPMWRTEKISLDEQDGDIPPLIEQFESRTGLRIEDL